MTCEMYQRIVPPPFNIPVYEAYEVKNSSGEVLAKVFRNALDLPLLQQMTQDITNLKSTVRRRSESDSRNTQYSMRLGYYLEQGGKGLIRNSPFHTAHGEMFQQKYASIWQTISNLYQQEALDHYTYANQLPSSHKPFGVFSQIFINLTPPPLAHIDCKDVGNSFVFYLGDFESTYLHLYYLNVFIHCKVGDLIMLASKHTYHKADTSLPTTVQRYSVIVTNHNGLIKRFIK
jgi:hypothetical protein